MKNHIRNRLAFSAIELLIVALIIGILSAVAVPRYMDLLTRHSLRAAAKRVAIDFEMVMSRAKMKSQSLTIAFVPEQDYYKVSNLRGLSNGLTDYIVSLNEEPYRSTLHNALFDGAADLEINGYGLPEQAGAVVIRRGDWIQIVTINKFGEVIIHPGPITLAFYISNVESNVYAPL